MSETATEEKPGTETPVEEATAPETPKAPVMDVVDYEVLKQINNQKQQMLTQIGAVEEVKHKYLRELDQIEDRRQNHAAEIQKKYDLPDGKLWRVMEDRTIMVMDPSQLQ